MGRFNVEVMRHLEREHFRVLTAVEMGMKNHELVPIELIASIAGLHRGVVANVIHDLLKPRALAYERGKRYDGYRLTFFGYDVLALKALSSRNIVGAVGGQIGVGKESDVFIGDDPQLNNIVLKFHRLGRTSFRKVKEKRDYHKKRKSCSWLYLSRLAASKEFSYLKALHEHKFPVPKPIDICRHLVVMEMICGITLCNVRHVNDAEGLYDKLMEIIVRLAHNGLIHGDFNEFNIMLTEDEEPKMIDLPQMVSMDHPNAQFYFDRDVECIRTFFKRRFDYESELYPIFKEMSVKRILNVEVNGMGFTSGFENAYNEALEPEQEMNECSGSDDDDNKESSDLENDEHESDEDVHDNPHNERLSEWVINAQKELEKLDEDAGPSFEEYSHSVNDKPDEPDVSGSGDQEEREPVKDEEDRMAASVQSKTCTRSVFSTGSTIAPEVIRKRIAAEAKATQKRPLRVKGKATALVRQRKTNANVIKEYSGWDL